MRQSISALIFAAASVVASVAAAQESSDSSDESSTAQDASQEASERFRRGVTLYREGSFDAALAEFNRAYELAPDHRLLYNIGQVHAELGDFVMAVKCFRQYLKDGGNDIDESRVSEVKAEIRELDGRIADLSVSANVAGAELLVDGESVGLLPLQSVKVNAGTRRVLVRKPGYQDREERVTVSGRENKVIAVTLKRDGSALSRTSTGDDPNDPGAGSADRAGSGLGTGFWVSAAATTVAAGATAVFAVMTRNADDQLSEELDRYPGSASDIDDARSDVERFAMFTDGCGALALIGLATTVYFAATGSGESHPSDAAVGGLTLRTGPLGGGRSSVGWQVGGRF